MSTLILASSSPRRQQFLTEMGYCFEVCPADIDETPLLGERPAHYVLRLANEKAYKVATMLKVEGKVLAGDTTVALGTRLFGKPQNAKEALNMLKALENRWHTVHTAISVLQHGCAHSLWLASRVRFGVFDEQNLQDYVQSKEPLDVAGGYAIQGYAGRWVREIQGSYGAIVGLPKYETHRLLAN